MAAVAGLISGVVLTGGAGVPASAVPADDAATVQLAGLIDPAAPDASTVATITIPLRITNTTDDPLYDVGVASLRSAPITTSAGLDTAFTGTAIDESESTTRGPRQPLPAPLAPGASVRFDYRVDSSADETTGICLCFPGVYALDLLVTAADEAGGENTTVARTQTYLPSLTEAIATKADVGWLWPLLDRPHRLSTGSVFSDDDLAASVASGGRLDRALQVVQSVDATAAGRAGVSRSMVLLLDPEIVDELVTMTRSYTVQAADGSTTTGSGGRAAAAWLERLAEIVPRHDVRFTAPSDPDVVGLAARGIAAPAVPDDATVARIATALGLPAGRALPHDLAWPVESALDPAAIRALVDTGATRIVTAADTDDDGAIASLAAGAGGTGTTPALLADPALTEQAHDALTVGQDNSAALQRLVVTAAMTSVQHPDDRRLVLVVPDRDLDVAPAAATRAVLATTSLGTPTSLVTGAGTQTGITRADLLNADQSPAPAPLTAALDAAQAATAAAATVREAVVSGADGVIGDLAARIPRAVSNSWIGDPDAAARSTADLTARGDALGNGVQVVVRATGNYSLASADAPLLLTVANDLAVAVRIRIDVAALGRSNGFQAGMADTVVVAANSRQTIQVPTKVTRSGRFQAAVTLRTAGGAVIGSPAEITVTSTAVGTIGRIVTFGAGALLVLALLVRGVRRLVARSRAGSDPTGPDDDPARPDDRSEDHPTVPATPS